MGKFRKIESRSSALTRVYLAFPLINYLTYLPYLLLSLVIRFSRYRRSLSGTLSLFRELIVIHRSCSKQQSILQSSFGGDERNRTAGLLLARQALSHLSYTPTSFRLQCFTHRSRLTVLVGSSGLEPPTSRLSGARSNRLSYEPIGCSASLV